MTLCHRHDRHWDASPILLRLRRHAARARTLDVPPPPAITVIATFREVCHLPDDRFLCSFSHIFAIGGLLHLQVGKGFLRRRLRGVRGGWAVRGGRAGVRQAHRPALPRDGVRAGRLATPHRFQPIGFQGVSRPRADGRRAAAAHWLLRRRLRPSLRRLRLARRSSHANTAQSRIGLNLVYYMRRGAR